MARVNIGVEHRRTLTGPCVGGRLAAGTLLCSLVVALAWAAAIPAAAAPLRVSLRATEVPAVASMVPGRAETGRFVMAGAPDLQGRLAATTDRAADDDEALRPGGDLVPALVLPLQASAAEPEWLRPDDAPGMLRMLGDGLDGAARTPAMKAAPGLGDFVPPPPAVVAQGEATDDAVQAAAQALDEAAPLPASTQSAAAGATHAAPQAGDLPMRRLLIMAVVPPLALAATAVLWRLDRGGRKRRRTRRSGPAHRTYRRQRT